MFESSRFFQPRALTPARSRMAYAIAIGTDVVQLALGPLGWTFADEALDLAAGVALSRLLGFHPLLLPTFVLELVPVADMLPTWTGCVALVLALRRRQRVTSGPPVDGGKVIDV